MGDLKRSIELTLKGKAYKIDFPNIGKIALIETNKAMLSNGMYGSMYRMATDEANDALLMVDIEAHLTVLAPSFIKDMLPRRFQEFDYGEFVEIAKVYTTEFKPWFDGMFKAFKETK